MKIFTTTCVFLLLTIVPAESYGSEAEVIAVIGTGDMGDSLGPQFAKLGHKVVYGSRRPDGDSAAGLAASTGNGAIVRSQHDAAQMGDIIVLAIPWPAMETVAQNLGNLDGKIIIDVSVPWRLADDGYPEIAMESGTSSAELIQGWNPGSMVVKALGTAGSGLIDDPLQAGGPVTMPIASDHREAKERIAKIVADMGFDPVDFGPLRMARFYEAMQAMWLIPLAQRRATGWEIYFRRNHWPCEWGDISGWLPAAPDADDLADIPQTQDIGEQCP